jgi:regulator of protease activity HflC (stomatin/prohibitin superfamily)
VGWFITAIVLFLIGLFSLLFLPKVRIKDEGASTRMEPVYKTVSLKPIGLFFIFLAIVPLIFSMFAIVGAKNVGVPTVFGKPTGGTYGSGLNFKAPWVSVTDIDATVQPEEYKGDSCIYVKIADAGSACVSLAYRWRINPDGADTVYSDYRNAENGVTEAVRSALVSTNIKAAINEVFGTYDPLEGADITSDMSPQEISNLKLVLPPLGEFNEAIKTNVEEKIKDLGDLIEIQSVTISYLKLPDSTQARIDKINAKVADTKLAIADVAIKKAQSDANKELASSLQDPNVLVSKCLDGMIEGEIKAPAGFQCFPNSGSSVVIPSAN